MGKNRFRLLQRQRWLLFKDESLPDLSSPLQIVQRSSCYRRPAPNRMFHFGFLLFSRFSAEWWLWLRSELTNSPTSLKDQRWFAAWIWTDDQSKTDWEGVKLTSNIKVSRILYRPILFLSLVYNGSVVCYEIFEKVYFCGLAIFCVMRELIFAIRTDWFFLLQINILS